MEIVRPLFQKIRETHKLDPTDPIWWTFDGETYQIEIFKSDDEVIRICNDEGIMVMKCCASATEIQNLLDDSTQFLATKKILKHETDAELAPFDWLLQRIKAALQEHDNDPELIGPNPSNPQKMKPWWVKTASKAILRIWFALRRSSDPRRLTQGAENTGQFKEGCYSAPFSIGFEQIMKNIKRRSNQAPLTKELYDLYAACLEEVTALFSEYGEASDMKMCEIIRRHKPDWVNIDEDFIDQFVVHRRRCIFLTNVNWLRNERQKIVDAENAKLQLEADKLAQRAAREERKRQRELDQLRNQQQRQQARLEKEQRQQHLIDNGLQGARAAQLKDYIGFLMGQMQAAGLEVPNDWREHETEESSDDDDDSDDDTNELEPLQSQRRRITPTPDLGSKRDMLFNEFKVFNETKRSARAPHVSTFCAGEHCIDNPGGTPLDATNRHRCLKSAHHTHLCYNCWMNRISCMLCTEA